MDRSTKLLSRCPLFLVFVRRLRTFLSSAVTCCSPEREIRSIHPPREGGREGGAFDRQTAGRQANSLSRSSGERRPFPEGLGGGRQKSPFIIFSASRKARAAAAKNAHRRGTRLLEVAEAAKFTSFRNSRNLQDPFFRTSWCNKQSIVHSQNKWPQHALIGESICRKTVQEED